MICRPSAVTVIPALDGVVGRSVTDEGDMVGFFFFFLISFVGLEGEVGRGGFGRSEHGHTTDPFPPSLEVLLPGTHKRPLKTGRPVRFGVRERVS